MKKLLLASALVFGLTATIPSLASAYVMCRPNDWMWCNWPPSQRYPSTQPQQYPSTQPRQYPSTKEIEAEAKPEPAPAKQTTPYEQIVAVLDGWN